LPFAPPTAAPWIGGSAGAIKPSGSVDWAALRWHLGLWDPWFLVWGLLLAAATRGYAITRSRAEPAS